MICARTATIGRRARFGWAFMRVSGALLVVLAVGHLVPTHYLAAPSEADASFVAARWTGLGWMMFDWLLLVLALTHGSVGLQAIAAEGLAPAWRAAARIGIGVGAAFYLGVGSATIVAFGAAAPGLERGPLSEHAWFADLFQVLLFGLATATYLFGLGVTLFAAAWLLRGRPLGLWQFHGQWAWALHRATGVAILGFLVVHVLDLALLPLAPDVYDRTVRSYAHPYLIPMEIALVAAVLYHAFNGLRVIALEIWDRRLSRQQTRLFAAVIGVSVLALIPSIVVLVRTH
jgi:succinate dehydrogenase / fumarate reductase cytochrome b subunit